MVKTILYKRTIALGTSTHFRKDLRRSEPRGDSCGSGWRKEAVKTGGRIHNNGVRREVREWLKGRERRQWGGYNGKGEEGTEQERNDKEREVRKGGRYGKEFSALSSQHLGRRLWCHVLAPVVHVKKLYNTLAKWEIDQYSRSLILK